MWDLGKDTLQSILSLKWVCRAGDVAVCNV